MPAFAFYVDYLACARDAREYATRLGLDVALRAVREYGKAGYSYKLASVNDSDYARAEIIRPGEPT